MSSCISASCSGLAVRPRTALAASPGSTSVPAKMRMETTKSVATAAARRRTTKRKSGRRRRAGRAAAPGAATSVTVPAAAARAGRPRPRSRQVDVAVVPAPEVEEGARLDPLVVLRGAVHEMLVCPDDVAALLVLSLLDLVPELGGGFLVRGALRLPDEPVGLGVAPVRLVPDGVREERLLVPERNGGVRPERLGKVELRVQERRVEVRVRGLPLDVDGDVRALRLLGEERGRLDEPRDDVRCVERYLEALVPRLPEERRGLLQVLLARRQILGVEGHPLPGEVVPDCAEAEERAVDERLPVGDEPEGLAHTSVVEGCDVDGHEEHLERRALGRDHLYVARLLLLLRLRERHLADHVDLAGEQRVQAGGVVVDRDVLPFVDVWLALVPVVRVARAEAALPDRERLEHERSGADGPSEVRSPVLDHHGVLLDEGVEEARVRAPERDLEREVVHLADVAEVDVQDARVGDVARVAHLREGVDDVIRGERLAVVPDDIRPQLDLPERRVLVRVPLEREAGLDLERRADAAEGVEDVEVAGGVDEGGAARRVEGLAPAGADVGDAQAPAPPRPALGRSRLPDGFLAVAAAGGQ